MGKIFLRLSAPLVLCAGLLFFVFPASADAATLYAKAAGGNWSAAGTWSTTGSGGGDSSGPPTAADNVIFEAGSGNVTIDAAAVARSVDMTSGTGSFTGTLTHNSAIALTIGDAIAGTGNVAIKFSSGMTYTKGNVSSSAITFASSSATVQTVTTAGKVLGNTTFASTSDSGSWQLVDAFSANGANTTAIQVTRGTLDVNGQTVSVGTLISNGNATRTLTLGAASIIASTPNTAVSFSGTGLTFNANTSTITATGAGVLIAGNGVTFNNLVMSGGSTATVTGANTYANFTMTGTASKTNSLSFAANQTITETFTINGNSAINRIFVWSSVVGTARTITAATVTVTNADFQDIIGAGAGSWDLSAITGNSGDAGGNSGITFTTPATQTATGTASFTWSTHGWTSRVPLPQDDVVINNSFIAGRTVTMDMPRMGKSVDFTGAANSPTFTISVASSIFGSLNLTGVGATTGAFVTTFEGRSSYTLTTSGVNLAGHVTFDAPGGTLTLQNAVSMTGQLIVTSGTFNANNFNITASIFQSSNSNTRTVTMGSGTWTLTSTGTVWSTSTTTGLTLNPNTSTIKITDTSGTTVTFAGGGKTFNNVWFSRGASTASITIGNSNTFANLKDDGSAAHSILFTTGTTTTVSTWTVSGTAGNLITINSTTTGAHNLVKSGGGIIGSDYLNIQHSIATPSNTWYAGTNSTNNQATATAGSGWIFANPTACTSLATGNWNTAATWDCGHVPITSDTVTVTAGHTVTMDADSAVLGAITVNGTLNTSDGTSRALSGTTITIGSAGILTANASTITLSGTTGTPFSNSGTFTVGTSTVNYTGNNSGGNTTVANVTYYNLTLNNASETYVLAGSTTVGGNLTITAGTLDTVSGQNYSLSIGGNWSNAGTFTARSGTVTLTSTSASAMLTSGGSSFYALTQNGSGGTYTLQDALTTTNNLTITAGTLDTKSGSNHSIIVGGNWSNAGTFTSRSGTVTMTGTDTDNTLTSGGTSFYALTVNGTNGVVTAQDALITTNALTIGSSSTLDIASQNLTLTGATFSNTGTLKLAGSQTITGMTNDTDSGTVIYTGTTSQTGLKAGNSYYNLTINDGLVGYWKFDEGTGTAANDSSGNGLNGVLRGGMESTGWSASVPSVSYSNPYALAFDGSNDYVNALDSAELDTVTTAITFSGWVKPNSGTLSTRRDIIQRAGCSVCVNYGTVGGDVWWFNLQNGGKISFYASGVTGGAYKQSTGLVSTDVWTHIAVTYEDATDVQFYVNGALDSVVAASGSFVTSNMPIGIGANAAFTSLLTPFSGSLDDLRIYKRALSSTEVTALASGTNPASITYTLNSALTVNGNLTLTSGVLDVSASNYGITTAGNWSNTGGVFTKRSGTVTLNGSGTQSLASAGSSFYNITHSGTGTVQLADALTFTNSLDNSAGTFDLYGMNLTATGASVSNTANIQATGGETVTGFTNDADSGSVIYNGSSSYTGLNLGNSYNNVTFNGTGTWTLTASPTINNNLIITAGTLSLAGYNLAVPGTFTNAGTLMLNGTETSVTSPSDLTSSGTVAYNNSGTVSSFLLGNTYNNLTLQGSGTVTFTSDPTIKGNFVNNGTVSGTSDRTFTLSGVTQLFNSANAVIKNLIISGTSGVVTLGSNSTITDLIQIVVGRALALANYVMTATTTLITNNGTITPNTGTFKHTSSSLNFTDSNYDIAPVYSVPSENVYVNIVDSNRNLNGQSADTFTLTITAPNDSETVTMTETGIATGVFRSAGLTTATYAGSATTNDGTLAVSDGDGISTSYTDAYDNTDTRSANATISTTARASAPSSLAGTAPSSTSITWTWTDNSNNEAGFKLYDASNNLIATISTANTTSYTETGLTKGTSYTRKVVAYNNAGNSSYSSSVSVTTPAEPTAPSSFAGTAQSNTSITWTWTDNANDENGFKLLDSNGTTIATITTSNTTSYTETGLTKNTSYTRKIAAYNDDGTSVASSTATVTTNNTSPTTPVLVSPVDSALTSNNLPTFTFKKSTEENGTIESYTLTVGNQTFSNIPASSSDASNPASRTHSTDKYTAQYFGEGTTSTSNQTIAVSLKDDGTSSLPLNDGTYVWYVTAVDTTSNSTRSNERTLYVDSTNPKIVNTTVTNQTLTATLTDNRKLKEATVTISKASKLFGSITSYTALETRTFTLTGTVYNLSFTPRNQLEKGNTYKYTLTVTDSAGNEVTTAKSIDILSDKQAAQEAAQALDPETDTTETIIETLRNLLPQNPINLVDLQEKAVVRRQLQSEHFQRFFDPILAWLFNGTGVVERSLVAALEFIGTFIDAGTTYIASFFEYIIQIAKNFANHVLALLDISDELRRIATILSTGRDVRIRQGLANRQRVGEMAERILNPLKAQGARIALKARATYEVWVDATPTKISNLAMKNLTPTSVTVSWDTNHLTRSGKVNYGTSTSYTEEVFEEDGLRDYHEVVLTGLRPETTYYFEVMNQNGGYVYDAYYAVTTPSEDQESSAEQSVFIPQDAIIQGEVPVPVYEEPEPNAQVVKTLLPGAQLRALTQKDGWISLLLTSGQEVWVQEEHVMLKNHEGESTNLPQE